MKFIDLFAGIGGFRLGFEQAGHECAGHCEIDKFANKSYIEMHKPREDEWFATDITRVRADDIPRCDCWCFGFPCQDISVAGKGTGFKGNRSSLFFAVTRLIKQLEEKDRPSYLLIENVKNLLGINRGFDFAKLLIELDEIGYDAEWQVINSSGYVPQNRERIFIVGHFRGRGTSKVFPIEGADGKNSIEVIGYTRDSKVKDKTRILNANGMSQSTRATDYKDPIKVALPIFCDLSLNGDFKTTENARCLQARYRKGISKNYGGSSGVATPVILGNVNPSGKGMNGNVYSSVGLSPTLTTNKGEGNKIAIPVLTPDREKKRQNGRRFKEDGEPMFTLTSQDRHGVMIQVSKKLTVYAVWVEKYNCYMAIRKLTPLECFRLQGFPDEYFYRAKAVNSDSQLYKQAGNSVTVPVIYEIAKRMQIDACLKPQAPNPRV